MITNINNIHPLTVILYLYWISLFYPIYYTLKLYLYLKKYDRDTYQYLFYLPSPSNEDYPFSRWHHWLFSDDNDIDLSRFKKHLQRGLMLQILFLFVFILFIAS